MVSGDVQVARLSLFFSDPYSFPLPDGHRFPVEKYSQLRQRILESELSGLVDLLIPVPASEAQLGRVHSAGYIQSVLQGTLTDTELRRIGFPWSTGLVTRSLYSVGGTIAACHAALSVGVAMNLAGGTHHAHRDFGSGFCVFNDVAVAARAAQAEWGTGPILIIDCDVHQGDGTASIFEDDPSVFTFSIHAERNFPFRKSSSDLDLPLPDGCRDEAYLDALSGVLDGLLHEVKPDLALYLAGADPYHGDTLGRLELSKGGLATRDASRAGGLRPAPDPAGHRALRGLCVSNYRYRRHPP